MSIMLKDILKNHKETIISLCETFGFSSPRFLYLSDTEEERNELGLIIEDNDINDNNIVLLETKLEELLKVKCNVLWRENVIHRREELMGSSLPLNSPEKDYQLFFSDDPGGFESISFKELDRDYLNEYLFKSSLREANQKINERNPALASSHFFQRVHTPKEENFPHQQEIIDTLLAPDNRHLLEKILRSMSCKEIEPLINKFNNLNKAVPSQR